MIKIVFSVFIIFGFSVLNAEKLRLMTYNIRGYNICDAFIVPSEHWYYRKNLIIDIVKKKLPDILVLQEIYKIKKKNRVTCKGGIHLSHNGYDPLLLKDIKNIALKQTNFITIVRDYVVNEIEALGYKCLAFETGSPKPICFKKNQFKLLEYNIFYPTKKKEASYAILKRKKYNFLIFNIHLISGKKYTNARSVAIDKIIDKINSILNKSKYSNLKVFIMGDFNINVNSKLYHALNDRFKEIGLFHLDKKNQVTYNGYGMKRKKLDYIFSNVKPYNYKIGTDHSVCDIKTGSILIKENIQDIVRYPSDHWPLILDLNISDTLQ